MINFLQEDGVILSCFSCYFISVVEVSIFVSFAIFILLVNIIILIEN